MGAHSFFGVDDEGELVGLKDSKKDSEDLSEAIKCDMDPVPEFELELHEQDGRRFMVVRIVAGNETPYYVHLKGHRDAFVRIGNESVKANATQLKRLVLKSEHRSFDSLETGYRLSDYSFEVLRATYHDKTHKAFENSDFESFGLSTDKGTLTNVGALFADNSPIRHSRGVHGVPSLACPHVSMPPFYTWCLVFGKRGRIRPCLPFDRVSIIMANCASGTLYLVNPKLVGMLIIVR